MNDHDDQRTNMMRRPIAARQRPWARAASRALIRVGLTPNVVSIISIAWAAAAGAALAASADVREPLLRAAVLLVTAIAIQLRLLCNLLDGLMAVEGGMRSPTGDLYNDVPDRFSDAIVLIAAGCAARHLDFGLTLGWLAALLALITAYVRVLGAASGVGHDFRGPMAKQQRMAIVTLACIAMMFDPWWGGDGQIMRAALALIALGCVITIIRRLRGIALALRQRRQQEPSA
jgi:phosphatidylglycerophosphate synthase